MLRTRVPLGTLLIEVEAEDVKSLLQEVGQVQELNEACEGHTCVPFHRRAGGFDFYGLRREGDGYEVLFGQHKADKGAEAGQLFARRPTSKSYVGFQPARFARPGAEEADPAPAPDPEQAGEAPRAQPSRAHAAMIFYIRRHFQEMKRLGWQIQLDGRPVVMAAMVGSREGWDRLVGDELTATQLVRRIEQIVGNDPFSVEVEHRREEDKRSRGEASQVRSSRTRARGRSRA